LKRRRLPSDRLRPSRRPSGVALLAFLLLPLLAIALVLGWGMFRYGGPEGLVRRVNAEFAARQPRTHSLLVPTPLALIPPPAGFRTATPEVGSELALATPEPTPAFPAAATPASTSQLVQLSGLSHMWQTWNNCGPATLAMNMNYFGFAISQAEIGASLRPYADDKNVSPDELAAYARTRGLHAQVRVNGDTGLLRQLLDGGIPVLIETWHEPEPDDGMGHYRLLTGYDDASQEWIAYDSFDATGVDPKQPYAGIRVPYARMDHLWKVFNRLYVIVYPDTLAPTVQRILGQDMDYTAMWRRALEEAQAMTEARPGDAYAWFNLGTDFVALGNYDQAATAYDQARRVGLPWRMLWYQFGPFQAYYGTGRFDEVIALADATLQTTDDIEEIYYWKGLALNAQGRIEAARDAWKRALVLNPGYTDAAAALADPGR
jgi:hypothetical protein